MSALRRLSRAALALAIFGAALLAQPVAAEIISAPAIYPIGTAYTPSISCSSGAITTNTITGRYTTIGKMVYVDVNLTLTTGGTCAGFWNIGFPAGVTAKVATTFSGEDFNSLKALSVAANASASNMVVTLYDGTYPGVDGHAYTISGWVEAN